MLRIYTVATLSTVTVAGLLAYRIGLSPPAIMLVAIGTANLVVVTIAFARYWSAGYRATRAKTPLVPYPPHALSGQTSERRRIAR